MQELKPIDISLESRIVASIVSDTALLDQCGSIIDSSLFESPTTQVIVEWALDYYRHQKQAPGKNLKDIYITRKDELGDANAELVYAYMKRGDWTPTDNLEFSKKQLTEYIQGRAMSRLVDKLKAKVESGNIKECENAIAQWQKPEVRQSNVIDFFNDVNGVVDIANKEDEDSLLQFSGDLGSSVGKFVQSDFALWLAPPKRGKTWWLMYTALQAALNGNKVLYVSLEMTEDETRERFAHMLSGCSRDGEDVDIVQFRLCGEDRWEMLDAKVPTKPMPRSNIAIGRLLSNARKYSQGGELKILTYPPNSYGVDDLRKDLIKLESFDKFIPTMVVVDYADIMKFQYGNEKRFGLDKLYLELRQLNLERKFCLVSASQTGRQNVTGENDVTEADIAECAGKLGHATKLILINQTKDEKKRGIYRINVNLARHGGVSFETCVCASCLAIGRPMIDCHRLSSIYDPKKEKDGAKELSYGGFGKKSRGYEE